MKRSKQFTALILAAALMLSATVTAFAEDKTKYAEQVVLIFIEMSGEAMENPDTLNALSRELSAFLYSTPQSDTIDYEVIRNLIDESFGTKNVVTERIYYLFDCWVKGDYDTLERGMNKGEFGGTASASKPKDDAPANTVNEAGTAVEPTSAPKAPTAKNAWDGVWEMGAQILVIKNGGEKMYHVDEKGNGFTISVMSDEISANEIHSSISDGMADYYAEYDFILSADGASLTFTNNYSYNGTSMVTPASGTYVKTSREPYATYDLLRSDANGINMEPEKDVIFENPEGAVEKADYADNSGTNAIPTASKVLVNGEEVAFGAYNINGNNYFMLRDLAYAVNGSEKQFEVSWDEANNAISLTGGKEYAPVGTELQANDGETKQAVVTNSKVIINGEAVQLSAYNIDGSNYFMLRDIGRAFDFYIGWDGESNTITIETSNSYEQ